MNFWIEWALAVHRAIWFPLHWVTGLEQPAVELPADLAPPIVRELDKVRRRTKGGTLARPGHRGQLRAA
jgi:hypothetical protein